MPISKDKKLIQFACPSDLREKIEAYAKGNGITLTAAVNMLLAQQIKNIEFSGELARAIKGMSDDQLRQMFSESTTEFREALEKGDI